MLRFLIYARRHWQAMLVLIFFICRLWQGDFSSSLALWVAVGFAVVGMGMNLVVVLINRGMPARVAPEEIPDEYRPHYHPIRRSTRLVFLSDWIPAGNLLISPGDVLLLVAVAILLLDSFIGF